MHHILKNPSKIPWYYHHDAGPPLHTANSITIHQMHLGKREFLLLLYSSFSYMQQVRLTAFTNHSQIFIFQQFSILLYLIKLGQIL